MYIRFIIGKVRNETSRETGVFQAACQTRKSPRRKGVSLIQLLTGCYHNRLTP